jgi:hypothetical protein
MPNRNTELSEWHSFFRNSGRFSCLGVRQQTTIFGHSIEVQVITTKRFGQPRSFYGCKMEPLSAPGRSPLMARPIANPYGGAHQ